MAATDNSTDADRPVPELRKLSRDVRSASQDELELDPTRLANVRKALSDFDAVTLDDLAKKGQWTADTILDPQKFRNPLHELIVVYSTACETLGGQALAKLRQQFEDCLGVLLGNNVDINEGDVSRNTPLHLVCQHYGVDGAIEALIASGAKVNQENANEQTALHLACDEGTIKEVEALLNGGADPNALDSVAKSPLHYAVKYRRTREIIKYLVGCGASVDSQEQHCSCGSTPLHVAVRNDRTENVRVLLELGADPNKEDISGQTALHVAAAYDITGEITQVLLKCEASLDHKDSIHGETALHKAIKRNMTENVKILCTSGASLSVPDINGDSPLHCAATCCHNMEVWVTLLSAKQADIRIRNSKGLNVLERATRASNKLGVTVLKQVEG